MTGWLVTFFTISHVGASLGYIMPWAEPASSYIALIPNKSGFHLCSRKIELWPTILNFLFVFSPPVVNFYGI